MGDFGRIHPMPASSGDVPDDLDARLVVLGIDQALGKEPGNAAEVAAKAIFETRGNTPRLYRKTLVFLAADKARLQDLDEAVRKFLAWESILAEEEALNLSPHQVKQAETQRTAADGAVIARLPETYQWLLVPSQANPQASVTWETIRLSGQGALAERASKKLRPDLLVLNFVPTMLRREMDVVPLWRGDHVSIRQLTEDFGRYLYLPRLQRAAVLLGAIRAGLALLTWEQDSFAYAESFDETARRYRGLRFSQDVPVTEGDPGLLVRSEVARKQIDAEIAPPVKPGTDGGQPQRDDREPAPPRPTPSPTPKATRYHGTVTLDPARVGRDAGKIADEVITHLVGLVASEVRVTLEIEAQIPHGAPDNVVRTVTENSRTLKFAPNSGFETE
jgi:hypothetical protein